MSTQEPPKIEFPCDYSLRVIGNSSGDFRQLVLDTIRPYAPELDETRVTTKASRKATFTSVTLYIWATGVEQLDAIHKALKATGEVHMVL